MRVRAILALLLLATTGCTPDLGECDLEAATGPIYYDTGGFPAYPGQALVDSSCGAAQFCHSSAATAEDRLGAPEGLDLDVGVATSPAEIERLRQARRVAWSYRHLLLAEVEAGRMPPAAPGADAALNEGAVLDYRANIGTPEERSLPTIDGAEGIEMLRNWLACGAHVVEATEGESQGVGDIWPMGQASLSCPAGQDACGGTCVDTSSDPLSCGGCGVACGASQSCTDGACTCLNGLDACGPDCVELSTDVMHCGSCGNTCGDRFCSAGACVDSCPADRTDCGGSCVDLSTSLANCGGCGAACRAGETCEGGTCTCAAGFTLCGGSCVDLQSDPANCGGCGTDCGGGALCVGGECSCLDGQTRCGDQCVDTAVDDAHCGACGAACGVGESCSASACVSCGPTVSFSSQVEPIFDRSCTASGCHAGARPAASLSLTAGRSYGELVGVAASCGSNPLVTPGDVDRSYLWNKLTGVGICSGTQMPKRGTSLPQAELDLIRSWICRGAADD